MSLRELVTFQYRVARVPVAIADFKLVQRLPKGSLPREAFQRTVRTADLLAGWVLRDQTLARISTDGFLAPQEHAEPPRQATAPTDMDTPTREPAAARTTPAATPKPRPTPHGGAKPRKTATKATKTQQHDAARSNKSLASIRQGLLQTEAIAEVREHQAEEAGDDDT